MNFVTTIPLITFCFAILVYAIRLNPIQIVKNVRKNRKKFIISLSCDLNCTTSHKLDYMVAKNQQLHICMTISVKTMFEEFSPAFVNGLICWQERKSGFENCYSSQLDMWADSFATFCTQIIIKSRVLHAILQSFFKNNFRLFVKKT